jgi:galactoside O-acetyltransferase
MDFVKRRGRILGSFLSEKELYKVGFKSLGENVLISRIASIYLPELISIGNNIRIDDFVMLSGEIVLENNIHIAPYSALIGGTGGAGIIMKNYSGLSSRVTVYSVSDDYSGEFMTNPTIPSNYTNVKKGRVIIQKYVIVGATTVILPGVEIGEGTAVGAMSMVAKSLPEWKICSGIPARVLKDRSQKLKELERQYLDSGD